jgi:hypothetical protein
MTKHIDVAGIHSSEDTSISRSKQAFPKKQTISLTSLDKDIPEKSVKTKTIVEKDPKFVCADLPSNFEFYDFKELAISPVKGYTQSKFARAASEERTRHVVDAVSSLLPEGISAWILTVPDFYWLLYWIRLNFYTKVNMIHTAVCHSRGHLEKVASKALPVESLTSVHTISKTALKETLFKRAELDKFLTEADLSFLEDTPYDLCPATIRDIVDIEENHQESENYKDFEYLVDYSSFLQYRDPEQGYASQQERIDFCANLEVRHLETIQQFANLVSDYGVIETIQVTCPECRAEIKTRVSISAHSFL